MNVEQVKKGKGVVLANISPKDLEQATQCAPRKVIPYHGPTTEGMARHSFAFPSLQLGDRTQFPLTGWRTEPCKPAL
jgi:hypothetical protein